VVELAADRGAGAGATGLAPWRPRRHRSAVLRTAASRGARGRSTGFLRAAVRSLQHAPLRVRSSAAGSVACQTGAGAPAAERERGKGRRCPRRLTAIPQGFLANKMKEQARVTLDRSGPWPRLAGWRIGPIPPRATGHSARPRCRFRRRSTFVTGPAGLPGRAALPTG